MTLAIILGPPWSGQRGIGHPYPHFPASVKGELVAMTTPRPLLGSSLLLFWKGGRDDLGHHPWSALEWTERPWPSLPSFSSSVKCELVAMAIPHPLPLVPSTLPAAAAHSAHRRSRWTSQQRCSWC